MGRLFWKFFAAFWVGLATVALVVAAGVWLARWFDLVPVSHAELGRMNAYLQTTRDLIQMGDMAAVRHVVGAVDDEIHAAPYVIDSHGDDLLGRPIARFEPPPMMSTGVRLSMQPLIMLCSSQSAAGLKTLGTS